tara:strand:+ start:26 stop:208 length:183 start_codon:yes stop_codon:yes gene_type:complete
MTKSKWKPPKTRHRRWKKFKVVKIESVKEALKRGIKIEILEPREVPDSGLNEVYTEYKIY